MFWSRCSNGRFRDGILFDKLVEFVRVIGSVSVCFDSASVVESLLARFDDDDEEEDVDDVDEVDDEGGGVFMSK